VFYTISRFIQSSKAYAYNRWKTKEKMQNCTKKKKCKKEVGEDEIEIKVEKKKIKKTT
jgi:hypothetical protein